MNNFSRATSAFVLTASLLASSVAAVAQTQTNKTADPAQKTSQTQSETKQTQTEPKADAKAADPKAAPAATAVKSNKQLSTNEDPNMIGKRNINSGHHCQDERFDGEGSPAWDAKRQPKSIVRPSLSTTR